MFWDTASSFYSLYEKLYNGKVNKQLCVTVASMIDGKDRVLECACGTGMISAYIAPRCKELVATDFSVGMLKQASKNLNRFTNVKVKKADITNLKCRDSAFDKVVAGNVIHLLDDPSAALRELERICKAGGKIIIPTYINKEKSGKTNLFVKVLEKSGAGFKNQFDFIAYKEFFESAGYTDADYSIIEGKMPCAIAVITK